MLNSATLPYINGYIAGHAVTNIFYILRRQIGAAKSRDLVSRLLQHLEVASISDSVIRSALLSPITDFEDAVTSQAAHAIGAEIIVTRNISGFSGSEVIAVTPESFLELSLN